MMSSEMAWRGFFMYKLAQMDSIVLISRTRTGLGELPMYAEAKLAPHEVSIKR